MRVRTGLLLSILFGAVLLSETGIAQETMDVIYLKDGSRYAGEIVELKPDQSVTFRITRGTVYVFDWGRIERIVKEVVDASGAPSPKGLESWYMYWALGVAFNSYLSSLQTELDSYTKQFSLALDIPGFYWPLGDHRTILGCVVAGSADRYSVAGPFSSAEDNIHITQVLLSLSAMHFFGAIPGDGVCLRADAGLAGVERRGFGRSASYGTGFLVGAGYGLPVSEETRLLFQVAYCYIFASEVGFDNAVGEGESYETFRLTLGVLL